MSIESENNFINELKFDIIKDKIKLFLFRNINKIILFSTLLILLSLLFLLEVFYKNKKLENYNAKVYTALMNNKITDLENIYNNNSTPEFTKTFAALSLIDLYKKDVKKEQILKDAYKNEKDLFFKSYFGLIIMSMELNKDVLDTNYIEIIIKELDNKNNPINDLFMEQKALYFIRINKKDEAKLILDNLLKNDVKFKERINLEKNELINK